MKMSKQRLDVIDSMGQFFAFDPKLPELAPRTVTSEQVVAWEKACTNPSGFRQLKADEKCHVNKALPIDAKGPRQTVLRFPQWIREYTLSKGHFDLAKILSEYNAALVTK